MEVKMPNVIIVGFEKLEAKKLRDQVDAVIKRLGKEGDSVTSILSAETKWCGSRNRAPYLIVRHTKPRQAKVVASALHLALNLDIEIEVISGFLASVTQPPEE
jgi:hypothetical protein